MDCSLTIRLFPQTTELTTKPEMESASHDRKHAFEWESESHCGVVLSGLNRLRKRRMLFDVTLIVDGCRFDAHRVVLASCSEYFR